MKNKKRLCPQRVADACLALAWADDIDDQARLALEQAHDVIESLMARCITTSKLLENVEARLASFDFPLLGDGEEDDGI